MLGTVAAALAGTLVLVGLTVDLSGRAPAGAPSPESSPIIIGDSPLVGQRAPDFALQDLDGRTVRLSDYAGSPVIVNFWASWCGPCKVEFPLFRAARDRNAARGLEILGVIHNDSREAARAFVQAQGAPWPMLLDPGDTAWRAYGGFGLPTSFYIDRTGIVRAVSYGPPPSGVLDDQLAKIL